MGTHSNAYEKECPRNCGIYAIVLGRQFSFSLETVVLLGRNRQPLDPLQKHEIIRHHSTVLRKPNLQGEPAY
jgi:hypothetical protein